MVKSKMKDSKSYTIFRIINTALLVVLSFVFFYPYWNMIVKAFNAPADTIRGDLTFLPRVWTLDNIGVVLADTRTLTGFIVSTLRVISGSALALLVTYFAAYALLKKYLRGRNAILIYLTIPMFFGGGLIPTYKLYSDIGIYNSFFVYILPVAFNFFNMVVIRAYLQTVPESLSESARIDGASEIKILFSIMFPLSMPVIATILLWNAVFHWNDWTTTLYFVDNRNLFTLQYNLYQAIAELDEIKANIDRLKQSGGVTGDDYDVLYQEAIQSAQFVISTLPILCVYPFLQRYFVHGVMVGSIKE